MKNEKNDVPRNTFKDKIKRKNSTVTRMCSQPVLTVQVKWVSSFAAAHFPIRKDQLIENVKKLIDGGYKVFK